MKSIARLRSLRRRIESGKFQAKSYWVSESSNDKTGNIPQQWIGADVEEAKATCQGCPLLMENGGGANGTPRCYSHYGTPMLASASVRRAFKKKPHRYARTWALANRNMGARAARMGAIGCPCGTGTVAEDVAAIKAEGLTPICYCHHTAPGELGANLKGLVCASTDNVAQMKARLEEGWTRVTMPVPRDTTPTQAAQLGRSLGVKAVICPADMGKRMDGKPGRVTCNSCLLCDGTQGKPLAILFLEKQSQELLTIR